MAVPFSNLDSTRPLLNTEKVWIPIWPIVATNIMGYTLMLFYIVAIGYRVLENELMLVTLHRLNLYKA